MDGWDVARASRRAGAQRRGVRPGDGGLAAGPVVGQAGSRAIITARRPAARLDRRRVRRAGRCIREAQRVIRERRARLLLLGTPEQFGAPVPDGMTVIPISCQSEGALQVYVEPVLPDPAAGRRRPLADGPHPGRPGRRAGLERRGRRRRRLHRPPTSTPARSSSSPPRATVTRRSIEQRRRGLRPRSSAWSPPASAARPCSATSPSGAYPRDQLDRVRVPVGLDLGHTTHRGDRRRDPGRAGPAAGGRRAPGARRRAAAPRGRAEPPRRSTRSAG